MNNLDHGEEVETIMKALNRMHNATDCELLDLLAATPHKLLCDVLRAHLNKASEQREELSNNVRIQLRMNAHNYFFKKIEEDDHYEFL